MNWIYLHLLTNHIPIVLSGLGALASLVAIISRSRVVWIYALVTLTLAGLSVYPVFFAGGEAGDIVIEHDRSVRKLVDEHEEAADFALWTVIASGAVSAYGLYRLRKKPEEDLPVWIRATVVLVSLLALSTVARTALRGGEIAHKDWERGLRVTHDSVAPAKL